MNNEIWRKAKSKREYKVRTEEYEAKSRRKQTILSCNKLPHSPMTWIYLTLLGIVAALCANFMDLGIASIIDLKKYILNELQSYGQMFVLLVWILWCLLLCLCASAISKWLSNSADGSGIPQMKSALSGHSPSLQLTRKKDFLSMNTLVAKSAGCLLAMSSGLSVGKEGPFVHVLSIIAHQIGKLHVFQTGKLDNLRYLRAGVSAGVTAVFGAPVGGVLFSIEVTSNYYAVSNLWQGIICSSMCVLTFQVINSIKEDDLFEKTKFAGFELGFELFPFLIVGACSGVISNWIYLLICKVYAWKKKYGLLQYRYGHVALVAIVSSFLAYPFMSVSFDDRTMINQMFRNETIMYSDAWKQFTSNSPLLELVFYVLVKAVVTALPCGAPLPVGIFTPLFTIGAVFGRLFGEVLALLFPAVEISPAAYAVVGAASLAAASTHTVSTAVIVFELTGQLSHMLPIMLSVLLAYSIGGYFAPSIYDTLAGFNNIPVIPTINEMTLIGKTVENVMHTEEFFLTKQSTLEDARNILQSVSSKIVPVCSSKGHILIGSVMRHDLELLLTRVNQEKEHVIQMEGEAALNSEATLEDVQLCSPTTPQSDESRSLFSSQQSPVNVYHRNQIAYGPPLGCYSFSALPIDSYPPQVGKFMLLSEVYAMCCLNFWARVFVTHEGKLVGSVNINSMVVDVVNS